MSSKLQSEHNAQCDHPCHAAKGSGDLESVEEGGGIVQCAENTSSLSAALSAALGLCLLHTLDYLHSDFDPRSLWPGWKEEEERGLVKEDLDGD